jgi:hypothetical protein
MPVFDFFLIPAAYGTVSGLLRQAWGSLLHQLARIVTPLHQGQQHHPRRQILQHESHTASPGASSQFAGPLGYTFRI